MATNQESGGPERDLGTGRVEAFSDGVIAIAITLLVLNLKVPEIAESMSGGDLLRTLGHQWPSYLAYLISFLTIGIMWVNHHNLFRLIARTDHRLVVINLLLLLCISFVPFPTALIAESINKQSEPAAAVVYAGWFTVTAICWGWLWRHASRRGGLLYSSIESATVSRVSRRYLLGAPTYGVAAITGIWLPSVTLVICLALAVTFLLPSTSGA